MAIDVFDIDDFSPIISDSFGVVKLFPSLVKNS